MKKVFSTACLLAWAALTAFASFPDPSTVLAELLAGNLRMVSRTPVPTEPSAGRNLPTVAVIACPETQVNPQLLFDETSVHLFLCRVSGEGFGPDQRVNLEASAQSGGLRVIIVLGHSECSLNRASASAGVASEKLLSQIRSSSPLIARLESAGELMIVAAEVDLSTRVIRLLPAAAPRAAVPAEAPAEDWH